MDRAQKRLSSLPAIFAPTSSKRSSTMAPPPPPPPPPPPETPSSPTSDRGRLRKPSPNPQTRSVSANTPTDQSQPTLQQLQQHGQKESPSPLLPPPVVGAEANSRSSSMERSRPATPSYSRPATPTLVLPDQPTDGSKEQKKKKGIFGGKKDKDASRGPVAWVAGHPQRLPYDAAGLVSGRPMPELWDDTEGNCYVYLFPRNSGKGASFKVDSAVFAASPVLTKLAFGHVYSNQAIQSSGDRRHQIPWELDARTQALSLDPNTPPATPPQQPKRNTEGLAAKSSTSSGGSRGRLSNLSDGGSEAAHLYLPIKLNGDGNVPLPTQPGHQKTKDGHPVKDPAAEDFQTLIDIRNFFAFLCGQSIIATERKHSFFHIFMTMSGILRSYEFSNLDGSTFGEGASSSFDAYVEELGLADVRSSREKTIEGIVLAERMKSVFLYNEAFTHAAGKHDDLVKLNSPKYDLISSASKNRLARAAMDLDKRTASVRLILTDFDFTYLFTGIMSSKVSDERKEGVRFVAWKEAFLGFRKNLLALYKGRYGSWPPKASSKKNHLETSGLNRLVLRDMYNDMSSLYDLLVDRSNLTTRTIDGVSLDSGVKEEPTVRGLRSVLSEYDRSSPPVKPPVPFDLPKLPTLKSTRSDFGADKKKDLKTMQKKLKDDEIAEILRRSRNDDARPTPFVEMFREMEKKAAHGCSISELVDLRIGQWMFMYVVIQALPMLVCDAPGLKWTKGVEYFLSQPPRSGVPWANPNAAGSGLASAGGGRTWFSVGEGGGVVSLPSDLVEHGVEGVYRRSHCWVMAEKWTRENPIMNEALHEQEAINANSSANQATEPQARNDAIPPPPPPAANLLAPDSPSSRASKRNSSLGIGLEALPLPMGVTPDGSAPTGYAPGGGHYPPGSGPRIGSRPVTPRERPKSAYEVDTSKTFDSILGGTGQDQGKKKKK